MVKAPKPKMPTHDQLVKLAITLATHGKGEIEIERYRFQFEWVGTHKTGLECFKSHGMEFAPGHDGTFLDFVVRGPLEGHRGEFMVDAHDPPAKELSLLYGLQFMVTHCIEKVWLPELP
jgi:hypothetical protein